MAAERETLQLQLKERDEKHAAELKKEQDEVARLKEEIEAMKANHASEVERVRAEEGERQDSELRQCKSELLQARKSLATTSEALTNLQDEAKDWKLSLSKINAELSSKYLFIFASSFFLSHFPSACLQRTSPTPIIWLITSSGRFEPRGPWRCASTPNGN